jgi:GNAT superfamily N-acetyltransferase
MNISKSDSSDAREILQMLGESKGENLTPQQRAEEGFTQGSMDEAMLKNFQAGSGVFVSKAQASDNTVITGVAMTVPGRLAKHGTAQAAYNIVLESGQVTADQIFLYGPVTVRQAFRGKGILTQLLIHICQALKDQYSLGIAFVDKENHKSLLIHRHYPMKEPGSFELNGRSYAIFTFAPATVLAFYQNR